MPMAMKRRPTGFHTMCGVFAATHRRRTTQDIVIREDGSGPKKVWRDYHVIGGK
jgi:hypothetical protein